MVSPPVLPPGNEKPLVWSVKRTKGTIVEKGNKLFVYFFSLGKEEKLDS